MSLISRPPGLAKLPARPLLLHSCQPSLKTGCSYLCTLNTSTRWFGSQSKAAIDDTSFAYTWLTRTPHLISQDDVLSSLPRIPASFAESGQVPVLLVTPNFAPWINPGSDFLEQWMNSLFHNFPHRRPLHAITAIVDRIPDVRNRVGDAGGFGHNPDISESEGLSLLVVKEGDVRAKAAPPRRIRSTGSEEPALVYSVQTGASRSSDDAASRRTFEIGLRLANTIFVNGKENTLLGMRWTYDPYSSRLKLDQSVDLSSCVVASSTKSIHDIFELPLYPVSQRRKVITSMGNILRQLSKSTDSSSNGPMPASSELEKELPRYIAEHGIMDQRVSVWALVETQDIITSVKPDSQDRLNESIRAGGKLHRVMSGGGGWGKKQGLLSLDPEIGFLGTADRGHLSALDHLFEDETDTLPGVPMFDDGMVIDDLALLSQVARADDYIQFFVSVEPTLGQSKLPGQQDGATSCHFGVVSDADAVEELPVDDASQKDLVALPSYFGALSEKAITYQQPVAQAASATKLDVPGSRVELTLV